MIAILINGLATTLGALLGMLLKKGVPEKLTNALFSGIALCVAIMAVQGAVKTENLLLLLLSTGIGVVIGTALGIEDHMHHLGDWLRQKMRSDKDDKFVSAFVTLSIMQVIGAMSILGPVQAALLGDTSLLYFKSVLDGTSAFIFGAIYGIGTLPVGIVVFVYEMAFFLLASLVAPLMTADVIRELNAVGSIMILAIALNMLGLTKLKVADYLPGLFIPIIYYAMLG
ncbi:MAG: DUF554 domain-containing protein [Megasphaera sp.]|nr:DUF554 domain-containing protein [Megasphaera sp.]MCH4187656.1 DUF554 domain-containing protein [Megasphaera sp.]MCH4217148.1 DUF554 domain-containing protein [Megasphaera sp.]